MSRQRGLEEAVAVIQSGATVMVGGFGDPGTPFALLEELRRQGQRDLTLIKNDANEASIGIGRLIENDQVRRLVTSHIGLNRVAVDRMNSGQLEVVFFPQGILAEKIRIAGAGMYGFLSDIGIDTQITDPAEVLTWQGRRLKVESALRADFALIHAARADTLGNLVYRGGARNFNPLMAMAADHVIAETYELVEPGAITPDHVHTPGAFVSAVVLVDRHAATAAAAQRRRAS